MRRYIPGSNRSGDTHLQTLMLSRRLLNRETWHRRHSYSVCACVCVCVCACVCVCVCVCVCNRRRRSGLMWGEEVLSPSSQQICIATAQAGPAHADHPQTRITRASALEQPSRALQLCMQASPASQFPPSALVSRSSFHTDLFDGGLVDAQPQLEHAGGGASLD